MEMAEVKHPKWAVRVDEAENICTFDADDEMEAYAKDTAQQLPGLRIGIYRLERIAIAPVRKAKIINA